MKPLIRHILLASAADHEDCPKDEIWFVLGGRIDHYTGTASQLFVSRKGSQGQYFHEADAGIGDKPDLPFGRYMDLVIGANHYAVAVPYVPNVIVDGTEEEAIYLSGDANCAAVVVVQVFKVKDIEKQPIPVSLPQRLSGWQ